MKLVNLVKKMKKKIKEFNYEKGTYFSDLKEEKVWFLLSAAMEFGKLLHNTKGLNGNNRKMYLEIDRLSKKWLKPRNTADVKFKASEKVINCYNELTELPIKDQVFLSEEVEASHEFMKKLSNAFKGIK